MNIIQTLITNMPFASTTSQIILLASCVAMGFLGAIGWSFAQENNKPRLNKAMGAVTLLAFASAFTIFPFLGNVIGTTGLVNEQNCRITDKDITLWGVETSELPQEIQISGKSVAINNGSSPATTRVQKFAVNGTGWTILKLLGLKTPIESELGINPTLQKELEKIIGKKARGMAFALQTDSPEITQSLFGEFYCKGSTEKTIYGSKTTVFFNIDISGRELQEMINNPTIAKELAKTNLIAKK